MPSETLDSITIQGFRSIDSLKLELRSINILIGPNGSGKSNFVGAFQFLRAIFDGRVQVAVRQAGGANALLHFGSKQTRKMRFEVSFNQGENGYEVTLLPSDNDGLFVSQETVIDWDRKHPQPYRQMLSSREGGLEAGISDNSHVKIPAWVRQWLARCRVYHFHDTSASSPMKRTAKVNDNEFLRADGSNLSSYLHFLKEKHFDSYNLIEKTVQKMAPFFGEFQLKPMQLQPDDIRLEWSHRESELYFDASSLSDGTLRFIALATLFLQPEKLRPSVILLDEPELGLHPYAICLLASLIQQASVKTQVIVSTQSPLVLDYFQPEDVIVASRIGGATQLKRLDSQNLAEWLEAYSLGELWQKNEFGGRPGSAS